MSSSDDDEPLAVVAEKVKQKSELIDKKSSKKDAKKRKIETDSSESESEDSDRDLKRRRRRKKRKPPLEDEYNSDEIPLGDMSGDGEDNADEKGSHDGEGAEVQQEESTSKEINAKVGEGDEAVSVAGSESGSEKEGTKPSTSSSDNCETRKDDLKTEKKRKLSTDSSSKDSARSENKPSSSSADESDKEVPDKAVC
ncbi:hypothetical protein TELCIR_08611 [Teladorsagia circumcincta]|uniref:Uncharacterized protein n=1 Tax=Teladorsagia circumcincta TaxID=45464 RepID=A0A2G9UH24_TELCI|nr:hypothetical protein TELCIR_08611 [Teladorsagia circumcincta]